jgi:hypothetical protein
MATESSSVLIHDGIVLPMDGGRTVHDPGSVLVLDGVIAAVGRPDEVARHPAAAAVPAIDASMHAVFPGLHNGHLHSGLLRGTAESMALWEWLENHVDPAHRALTPDIARAASYMAYTEQITFLLFLKMAHEREIDLRRLQYTASGGKKATADCSWPTLAKASGTALTNHYVDTLRVLGQQPGILGEIYTEAQSRFNNPVNLKRLINLIDETHWTELGVDVKAAVYEGLLEKAASEGKKGAGQYFTPRVLIQSIVRCMRPDPRMQSEFVLCDPACGTGGFLVAAYEWLLKQTKGGALDRAVGDAVVAAREDGMVGAQRRDRLDARDDTIADRLFVVDRLFAEPGAAFSDCARARGEKCCEEQGGRCGYDSHGCLLC